VLLGLARRARAIAPGRTGYHLLSVVVPAYNVQAYLGECLDSLLAQSYRDIEVIVVVDGATDGTLQVANRYAGRDKRVRVHAQANAGLSAARNAGAALARGEFLWFVDSDDTVAPNAAATMIRSLRSTGSDFAVGSYRRFNSSRAWNPGSWIREAHTTYRPATSAREFPGILVNAVAWSKIYRRRFWVEHHFEFPVGAMYEDQPVSARAYALATAIDVIPDVIYRWRDRDDRSSISQQTHEEFDLVARLASANASLDEFRRAGVPELAAERALQLLCNDLPHSMKHLADAGDDFWRRVISGVRDMMDQLPAGRRREVPAHHAALEWLLATDKLKQARSYIEQDGQDPFSLDSAVVDGRLVLCVPFWDDPQVEYPLDVIELAPRQYDPALALRAAHWPSPGVLEMRGWAYIPLIAPASMTDPVTARLVSDEATPHQVPLDLHPVTDPDIDRLGRSEVHDFRATGFRTRIDVDGLGLHAGASYQIQFTLAARVTALETVDTRGSAGGLPASTSPDGVTARLVRQPGKPLELRLRRARARVASVRTGSAGLTVDLTADQPLSGLRLAPVADAGPAGKSVTIPASAAGAGRYEVRIDAASVHAVRSEHWTVRAVGDAGDEVDVDWPGPPPAPVPVVGPGVPAGLALLRTRSGNLGLRRYPPTAHLDSVRAGADAITVTGHPLGAGAPTAAVLRDHRMTVECSVTADGEAFQVRIPWTAPQWGREAPLPAGRYEFVLFDGGTPLETVLSDDAVTALPQQLDEGAGAIGRVEREPRTRHLALVIEPTLGPEESGRRPRAELTRHYQTGAFPLDENAVLFRTYYGENASCNALGIHHELRRRGADLRLYWTVKDSSVRVPEGGVPVVANSRRWFELLASAKYLVDNVHQPAFFTKRPGQVFVQTLHGYPFKKAGLPYWKSAGYGQARIDSFLHRQQQWDYLLSPAPYATPLLERDFPSDATTLEIGYPRNDIFFAEERQVLREHTRRVLGVPDGATAVLYAPTYRDNLSTDEFRASMVDFLDADAALRALGDGFVILVRGHPMNARVAARATGGGGRVIDVTDYPEISELCLASDAAILDYSSLRFDYALTGKPMIFLVPDLELYRDDVRGWMLPYEETAPGPLARDTHDVIDALADLAATGREYEPARQAFLRQYLPLEDGHASARLVDAVFDGRSGGRSAGR
jgi:CDP-glycerol glycerophosphotransferase